MTSRRHRLTAAMLVLGWANAACADFLIYRVPRAGAGQAPPGAPPEDIDGNILPPGVFVPGVVPGVAPGAIPGAAPGAGPAGKPDEMRVVLHGRMQINGRLVSYAHPGVREPLVFTIEDKRTGRTAGRFDVCELVTAPTTQREFQRRLAQAGKDPQAILSAATYGIKKRLTRDFYAAIEKLLEIDPKNKTGLHVDDLRKKLEAPLPDDPAPEHELRKLVTSPGMQVAASKHFVLLYDTSDKLAKGERKTRAQRRLDQLEQACEIFLQLFCVQNVELDAPTRRLKAVLFSSDKDYQDFAARLGPKPVGRASFFNLAHNVSVFCDSAKNDRLQTFEAMQAELTKILDQAGRARPSGDMLRFAKTLDSLIEVEREAIELESSGHAAASQMAANTGLISRDVVIPAWLREGLPAYFESSADSPWAGVGAVTEHRLSAARALETDSFPGEIEALVSDRGFDELLRLRKPPVGSGPAWAVAHYLLENRIADFAAYCRLLGSMPPDVALNSDLLSETFHRVFGGDIKPFEQGLREHMKSMKPDLDRLIEQGASGRGKG